MASLTSIPIDCWLCGVRYQAPAQISPFPPEIGDVYSQRVFNVWVHVDQSVIRAHVQEHWPVVVFWFFMWGTFVQVCGMDPLAYYRGWR